MDDEACGCAASHSRMTLAYVDVRPQYAVALVPIVMELLIAAQGNVLWIAMQPEFSRTQRVRECSVINVRNVVLLELHGVVACEREFFTVDPPCECSPFACQ